MYYLNYFFIFSIIGHLLETIIFNYSGILYAPWTPIYGIGVIIILLINKFLNTTNKYLKIFLTFILSSIILTIIEAIGGYLIEYIFHTTFWDYTNLKLNIGKYIALEMSLVWGICSLILIYILKPLFDKIVNKIPKFITHILVILFIIDLVFTISNIS